MGNNKFDMSILPDWIRAQPQRAAGLMQNMMSWGEEIPPNQKAAMANMQQQSPENQQQVMDFLQRLQVTGSAESLQREQSKSIGGGGRVGYTFPVNEDNLTLGMQGGGYKASFNTPEGMKQQSQFKVNGADVGYQNGIHNFGLNYSRENPRAPIPGNIFSLNYRRQF